MNEMSRRVSGKCSGGEAPRRVESRASSLAERKAVEVTRGRIGSLALGARVGVTSCTPVYMDGTGALRAGSRARPLKRFTARLPHGPLPQVPFITLPGRFGTC